MKPSPVWEWPKWYALGLGVLLAGGTVLFALYGKLVGFLWLNTLLPHSLQPLAAHLTHLGDALLGGGLVLAVLALLNRPYAGVVLLSALVLSGVVLPLLKQGLFSDHLRPLAELGPNLVNSLGYERLHRHSMPSGHSATLAIAGWGASMAARPVWQATWAVLAMLLALTRVMVGAHFPNDVLVGLAVGLGLAALATWLLGRMETLPFALRKWRWGLLGLAGAALCTGVFLRFVRQAVY